MNSEAQMSDSYARSCFLASQIAPFEPFIRHQILSQNKKEDKNEDSPQNSFLEKQLREYCQNLVHSLGLVTQDYFESSRNHKNQNDRLSFLSSKRNRIMAETEILQQTPEESFEFSFKATAKIQAKSEVLMTIKQLEGALSQLRAETIELKATSNEMNHIHDEHVKMNEVLSEKASRAQNQDQSTNNYERKLQTQKSSIETQIRIFMNKLASFLTKYFPADPEPKSTDSQQTSEKMMPLQTILEDLMNISVLRSHDSYLETTEAHWPPHIELLIRSGVAERHPSNCKLIKLVGFHL